MNLTRSKKSFARASAAEIQCMIEYLNKRHTIVQERETWNRLKHLKVGDIVYGHERNNIFWGQPVKVIKVMPRKRQLNLTVPKRPGVVFHAWPSRLLHWGIQTEPHPDAITEILTKE